MFKRIRAILNMPEKIDSIHWMIVDLQEKIDELKEDKNVILDELEVINEKCKDNMRRLNDMINEFKGLVARVRGEANSESKKTTVSELKKPKQETDIKSKNVSKALSKRKKDRVTRKGNPVL